MVRAPAALALGVLIAISAGCGGDDDEKRVAEGSLRTCLVGEGLSLEAPDLSASAGLGSATPDFRATTAEGTAVDFVVQGTPEKAERTAADISAARATLGRAGGEVLVRENAVAVFADEPSDSSRRAVEGCLSG